MGSAESSSTGQCGVDNCDTVVSDMWVDSDYNTVLTAVERGEDSAKTKLAWFKLSGLEGAKKDAYEAVALLEERVTVGDGEAMWMLGICKEFGIGTKQNIEEAKGLYSRSNKIGNVRGKILATNKLSNKGPFNERFECDHKWGTAKMVLLSKEVDEMKKVLMIAPLTELCLRPLRVVENEAAVDIQSVSEVLKNNSSLRSLDLNWNQIGSEGAQRLSEALKINTSLTSLGLQYNGFGDPEAKLFAEMLKTNTSLTAINLSCNKMGPEGVESLSESLKINTSLTELDLSANKIDIEGAKSLCESLKINSSLTSLILEGCALGSGTAQSFSESLKINTSLTNLDLASNFMGVVEKELIRQAWGSRRKDKLLLTDRIKKEYL